MQVNINGTLIKVTKTNKPKMSCHRGRTWDFIYITLNNIPRQKMWLDTTWGFYGYIIVDDLWYKFIFVDFTDILEF